MSPFSDYLGRKEVEGWKKLWRFLSQRTLHIGFVALMLVVLAMLGMQLWFLLELKESSSATSRLTMRDFLIAVVSDVDDFYRKAADQLLNVPPGSSASSAAMKARFRRRWAGMAKGFFVLNLEAPGNPELQFYGPTVDALPLHPDSPERRAINLSSARWVLAHQQSVTGTRSRLIVDERDEQNPVILKPIVNGSSHAVAVVGMILDPVFFQKHYLPAAIERHLLRFFPEGAQDNVVVSVNDGDGGKIYETQPEEGKGDEIIRNWSFVFTDWRLTIQSRFITPEQWAHRSFILNLLLTALMTVVVFGGIVVTMHGALRAVKLSQMKTEFVSNVSHELRTPLSSIQVLGEFLSAGRVSDPEKIRQYGEHIENETQRLTHLIDNILDFAKIESRKKTYNFEQADVAKTLAEVLQSVELGLLQDGFSIHYEAPPSAGPRAMIDNDAIAEAVLNLIDNAVKYSGSSRDIFVELAQVKECVRISVRDQGVGLRPEEAERIFEKFYRVSNGLVHNVRGSGLGLSIAKHIVEAHGGRITVESEPQRGSTFSIYLPASKE